MRKILVTGAAGFIGFHLCGRLIDHGDMVVGIDNLNDYYDAALKLNRLKQIQGKRNFSFLKLDITDREGVENLFAGEKFDIVVNMAAQAGVRYSIVNPHAYINSNINGFLHILEGCRNNKVKHLVFASSSSVYGANTKMPFSAHHNTDHPISLYAATKKANELMAHTYSSLFKIPCTGLRFFTVYGPWGRPDMSYFVFTKSIVDGKPIEVFNQGNMKRDFTFIDDIVEGVVRVIDKIPKSNPEWNGSSPDSASSFAPYRLYNIGNNNPVALLKFIETLEDCLGRKAEKKLLPMPAGDIPATYADVDDLMNDVGFKPAASIEVGIKKFVEWYKAYYGIK